MFGSLINFPAAWSCGRGRRVREASQGCRAGVLTPQHRPRVARPGLPRMWDEGSPRGWPGFPLSLCFLAWLRGNPLLDRGGRGYPAGARHMHTGSVPAPGGQAPGPQRSQAPRSRVPLRRPSTSGWPESPGGGVAGGGPLTSPAWTRGGQGQGQLGPSARCGPRSQAC